MNNKSWLESNENSFRVPNWLIIIGTIIGIAFVFAWFSQLDYNNKSLSVASRCWSLDYDTGSHKPVNHCLLNGVGLVLLEDAENFKPEEVKEHCKYVSVSEYGIYQGNLECIKFLMSKRP